MDLTSSPIHTGELPWMPLGQLVPVYRQQSRRIRGAMTLRLSTLIALTLLASACRDEAGSPTTKSEAASSAEDLESGQGRAFEAGRALIGKIAPAAVLRTIDGETIDLAAAYGKRPVYLKFWATWCVPCRKQMPGFEADFEKYRDKVLTVAVNTGFNDDVEAVRDYRERHGLTMPISIDDGSLGGALGLRVTPQHVVIGRDGRILFVGHEADANLHEALEEALAEPPAAPPAAIPIQGKSFAVGDAPSGIDPALEAAAGFPVTGAAKGGKPRVLVFFSPWCETYLKDSRPEQADACRRVREEVNQLAKPGGPKLVGISSGLWSTPKDLEEYRSKKLFNIPLHLDANGQLFRSFDVRQVPTLVVIDGKGRIARRLGPNDKNLNAAIQAAKAKS